MARGTGMQQVELLDGDDDVTVVAGVPGVPQRRRRRRWWIPAGALVVVLSLVVTQQVVDAREEAAVARLAAVDGVLPPLGDELAVLRRIPDADAYGLWAGVETGAGGTVGLVLADDGSRSVAATDRRTGETHWSVPVLGPDPQRAASRQDRFGGGCRGDTLRGEPATVAVCLVTDGFVRDDGNGTLEEVPATSSRVVVLDTGDGHVVAEWATDRASQLAVLDGLVVVGSRDADGDALVVGHDLRSGDVRWRYEDPAGEDDNDAMSSTDQFWALFGAGRLVGIYDGEEITLISSTGSRVRDDIRLSARGGGFGADPATGVLALSTDSPGGEPTTTLLAADGAPGDDVVVPGELLSAQVDDASLPGLVLSYDPGTSAWDRATGEKLWHADVQPNGGVLVIRGRVYLSTTTEVVALDGRTGEVDWSIPLPGDRWGMLATDSRHLLLLSAASPGGGAVTVLDHATGREIRQVPYPEGVADLQPLGGLLVGWSYDTEEVLLVE